MGLLVPPHPPLDLHPQHEVSGQPSVLLFFLASFANHAPEGDRQPPATMVAKH